MDIKNSTIGEIVAENYKTSEVFKKYGLDFCCNGNSTIADQCTQRGLDAEEVYKDLENATHSGSGAAVDFRSWPLDLLADYIQKTHHRYANEKIPVIQGYLDKIAQVHGQHHPELYEIKELFDENAKDFAMHMKKEELVLFPFIKQMEKAKAAGTAVEYKHFDTVENPVDMMMHDHTAQGDRLHKIEELSNNYTTPADGCNTYNVAYQMLREFDEDTHTHIHLENNILFPSAVALEKTLPKAEA